MAEPAAPGRILIIFNPVAGWRRRRKLNKAIRVFRDRNIAFDVHETRWPNDAAEVARDVDGRYDTVVSAGGDGTINEIVNGLMVRAELGKEVPPLGILPLGTANVLAAELGMPRRPADAAAAFLEGRLGEIHLGVANGRYFALMAGAGFDAYVVSHVKVRLKRYVGKAAYLLETLSRLIAYPGDLYRVTVDGREMTAASVVVAKSHFYGGRFVLAPGASLTRPDLQVCLFETAGRRSALRYMAAMLLGRLSRLDDYRVVPATRVAIHGAADAPVQADGDIVATLPLEIAVAPRTLKVVVPRGYSQ
ncbi:MAG TPA: diacylglycerol kinase family protein [Alphaproteobacteria bacterium]|nr:diacylglycerol kinase family protein [Alphaproteobacteria bacterium]